MRHRADLEELALALCEERNVIQSEAALLHAALALAGVLGYRTLALTLGDRRVTVALAEYRRYLAGETDRAAFRATWGTDALVHLDRPDGRDRV
jgi:hypothetical protein